MTSESKHARDKVRESGANRSFWELIFKSQEAVLDKYVSSANGEEKKQLWQSGNHPEEIRAEKFYKQKMQYIHYNPVRAGWVRSEEDYEWSSAGYFYKKSTAVTFTITSIRI